jgi:hypothetical protein
MARHFHKHKLTDEQLDCLRDVNGVMGSYKKEPKPKKRSTGTKPLI